MLAPKMPILPAEQWPAVYMDARFGQVPGLQRADANPLLCAAALLECGMPAGAIPTTEILVRPHESLLPAEPGAVEPPRLSKDAAARVQLLDNGRILIALTYGAGYKMNRLLLRAGGRASALTSETPPETEDHDLPIPVVALMGLGIVAGIVSGHMWEVSAPSAAGIAGMMAYHFKDRIGWHRTEAQRRSITPQDLAKNKALRTRYKNAITVQREC